MLIDAFNPYAWAIALATVGLAGFLGLPFWWLFQDGRRYRRLRRERRERDYIAFCESLEAESSRGTCSEGL